MEVLRAEKLISAACARARLSNFGEDGWRERLDVLLRSAAKEAALSTQGEAVWADTIIKLLCNRLEIEDWYSRHPEIEEQDFAGMLPVSATGPQECIYNLALEFRSRLFGSLGRIPTYIDWMLSCDMEPAYRYHRRVLKLLQW
jgi:hypothetical protein